MDAAKRFFFLTLRREERDSHNFYFTCLSKSELTCNEAILAYDTIPISAETFQECWETLLIWDREKEA